MERKAKQKYVKEWAKEMQTERKIIVANAKEMEGRINQKPMVCNRILKGPVCMCIYV